MALSIGDVLKTAKKMSARAQERDAALDNCCKSAENIGRKLNALEKGRKSAMAQNSNSSEESVCGQEKSPSSGKVFRRSCLSQPLPDFIMSTPKYRQLYEQTHQLYEEVAEQQLTLDMIMEKYRHKMLSSSTSCNHFVGLLKTIEESEGIIGGILHEKGVALSAIDAMLDADSVADYVALENIHELRHENAVLRDLVKFSLAKNGRRYLSPETVSPSTTPTGSEEFSAAVAPSIESGERIVPSDDEEGRQSYGLTELERLMGDLSLAANGESSPMRSPNGDKELRDDAEAKLSVSDYHSATEIPKIDALDRIQLEVKESL